MACQQRLASQRASLVNATRTMLPPSQWSGCPNPMLMRTQTAQLELQLYNMHLTCEAAGWCQRRKRPTTEEGVGRRGPLQLLLLLLQEHGVGVGGVAG